MYRYPINLKQEEEIRKINKKNADKFIKKIIKSSSSRIKRRAKYYSFVLKTFIKSVAIHISKMTDGYADHKVKKIISSKCID